MRDIGNAIGDMQRALTECIAQMQEDKAVMKARRARPTPVSEEWETLELERDRLKRELESAREDLVFYGNHLTDCAYLQGSRPCTCGLVAAITNPHRRTR